MKRFYKLVSTHQEAEGWAIHLDGKPVKTPLRVSLLAPNEALADEVMKEWAAQEEQVDPDAMPLTQILSTQIDRVSEQRTIMSTEILKFLDTDLLCYRAPKDQPPGQAERQADIWNPWLNWFEQRFNTKLQTTVDLVALTQAPQAHKGAKDAVENFDDAHFTALQLVVPLAGSLVLGLAFVEGVITPEQLYEAARVEEHFKDKIYNAEKYGRDPLQEKKDAAMLRDLEAASLFLKLL